MRETPVEIDSDYALTAEQLAEIDVEDLIADLEATDEDKAGYNVASDDRNRR